MEFFIRDISFSARKNDVELAISNVLHGGSFSNFSQQPINFDFRFIGQGRSNVSHRGIGALTLPEQPIGNAFLARYGEGRSDRISVNGRPVAITISRHPPRPNVVDRLLRTPYRDPRSQMEQQLSERAQDLATRIKLVGLEQGFMERDGTFLSEYSVLASGGQNVKGMSLYIDDTNRNILLDISVAKPSESLPQFALSSNYYIKFHYSSIYRITFDHPHNEPTDMILFQLKSPASYEYLNGITAILNIDSSSTKNRLSSLDFDSRHKELAAAISKAILVRLTHEDAQTFKRLCQTAQIGHLRNNSIYTAPSNMFSGSLLTSLRQWINQHEWEVAFQLERILTNMLLNPEDFNACRPTIDELVATTSTSQVCTVLLDFTARLGVFDRGEDWEEQPPTVIEYLQRAIVRVRHPAASVPRLRQAQEKDKNGEFPCLHVDVTPTRYVLDGPAPEQLNRVLRMYPDNWNNFIRVRFTDEEQDQYKWEYGVNGAEFVRRRVGGILKNGLEIAGRRLEYLGYSSSSLKSHSVWFVLPFDHPELGRQDAKTIIGALGRFSRDSKCPARMGARIAQAFSSTDLSVTATAEELNKISDIERNGSCFTDGVGTISLEFAEQIWKSLTKLRKKRSYFVPAAYQVRLGGYKGMLAIDYRLEGSIVCVRDSMDKFDSPVLDVEVARAFDKPGPCFLNRPLIMSLDTANKVPIPSFLELQRHAVQDTKGAMRSLERAARMLETHGLGTAYKIPSILTRMQKLDFDIEHCKYLGMKTVLKDAETDILRDLKHHARIPVPESWKLVGIADEFDYLKEGEIYACIRVQDQEPIYLEGPYLITRSPVIHPGDVQLVTAIGKPPAGTPFDKEPMANTVIFSCQGNRSLPSCLGGGDLDGDLYDLINLTAVPGLTPRETFAPAAYPPATKKQLSRDAEMDDVKEFICDFINSDMLGLVSVRHLRLADVRDLGVNDPDCLKLAELHSKAVDFQKSGTPVQMKDLPPANRMRPDWDAGEMFGRGGTRDDVYVSERALGQLYRDIKLEEDQLQDKGTYPSFRLDAELDVDLHAKPLERSKYEPIARRLREKLARYIHTDEVPREYFVEAVGLLGEYISELTRICNDYALTSRSIISEEEVVAGTILERTSHRRRRKDMISEMRTASTTLVGNVKDVLRGSDSDELEEWAVRSWAAYQVARASETFGRKSFGLLALGNAFDAMDAMAQRDRDLARRARSRVEE